MVSREVKELYNKVVKFMNNDLDTRDLSGNYKNYIIKTFNDKSGEKIVEISITRNWPSFVSYWFDYNRSWYEKLNNREIDYVNGMKFQINNKYVPVCVNLVSKISRENEQSMFNNFTEMKLEYIDCIFDKYYENSLTFPESMQFKNCIFMEDSK